MAREATDAAIAQRFERNVIELRDLLWLPPARRPRVGVSSCLLGERVRWDGGHKLAGSLVADLSSWAEVVATCPEVGMGLPVPRPPLVVGRGDDGAARLIERDSGRDHGAAFERFTQERLLALAPLDGYVWKAKSPSCDRRGGLFARAVAASNEGLPAADERDLDRSAARAAFRLATEWRSGWRFTAAQSARGLQTARLHRKLRSFWVALAPAVARALDRAAQAPPVADDPHRYAACATALLRGLAGRAARRASRAAR